MMMVGGLKRLCCCGVFVGERWRMRGGRAGEKWRRREKERAGRKLDIRTAGDGREMQ
jgi:hypothetical protein